jgi:hypothetical protein
LPSCWSFTFTPSAHATPRQTHFFNLTNFGASGVDIHDHSRALFRSTQITSPFGRFGVFLGNASYFIYLVTLIVFYGYDRLYPRLAHLGPDANVVLGFLSVAVVGSLCYLYVEKNPDAFPHLEISPSRPSVRPLTGYRSEAMTFCYDELEVNRLPAL